MTDLRKAAHMALNALEFSLPAIEDFGSKEQLTDCHRAIMALYKSIAQPEQEQLLPPVDIGVDVTPEGTHVVACYNRPDAVQEMFYSQFHPLTKPEQEPVCDKDPFYCWSIRCQVGKVCKHTAQPEQSKYSDIVSDGGLDPRNKFDAQPEQFVVSFPSFMRKRIEQALKDAIHPTGMSVHDGKAKVLVSDLHRMLLVIDSVPPHNEEKNNVI